MTNPQVRHAADNDEKRRLLREQLERPPQAAQEPDEADDWEDEDEDEDLEEPQRRSPRRRSARRSPRRRSARRATGGYDTSMVHADTIGTIMTWVIRIISLVLFYFSTVGTVGAFNGDVQPLLDNLPFFWNGANPNALIIGLALQAWVTGFETWRAPDQFTIRALLDNKAYTAHLALDIALSVIGYRSIVIPFMQNALIKAAEMPQTTALIVAYVLAAIGAAVLAVLPERMLIKR
jgi:hypothetical protein